MRVPLGYHQYTSTATVHDLTDAGSFVIPAGSRYVWLEAEVQAIRWRDDGTAPTASTGELLPPFTQQTPFEYWFGNPADALRFLFIAAAAGALLNASFYK